MPHNPNYFRYRIREKHRRIFVLTKTQFFFGFLVSLFFSLLFSSYFENYGHLLANYLKNAVLKAIEEQEELVEEDEPPAGSSAKSGPNEKQELPVEERLRRLQSRTEGRTNEK